MRGILFLQVLFLITFSGCRMMDSEKQFRQLSPEKTGVEFSNKLRYSDSLTVLDFEYMFNGGGVALCDVNNDGLTDILFTGNMVGCRLYLNKGGLQFEDITEKSGIKTEGWVNGVAVVDINQDGYPDFYISKAGPRNTDPTKMKNLFFINNGNNTFTEKAAEMNLDDNGYDVQAAFFDYDKDGDLDVYILRNGFVNYNRNTARIKQTDGQAPSTGKLFRNDGNLKFTNVSNDAGITIEGFGLGVSICDINNDNWPDIYVSNDFLTDDILYINNKNGTFTNKAKQSLHHLTYNGMGNDIADFNNDGFDDIMVVDMLPPDNKHWKQTMMGNTFDQFQQDLHYGYQPQYVRNTLQLNNGNKSFSEIGQLSGIYATDWSWAPLFADFDNDGWKDLFITNGYRQDITNLDFINYGKQALFMGTPEANRKDRLAELRNVPGIHMHNFLYKNNRDLTFTDVSTSWGMTTPSYSNGAGYADLDNDGDLDLVINNLDEPASIYENLNNKLHPDNAWFRVKFKGAMGNREGLGAKVWVWQKGTMQYNFFSPYRGYLSSVEPFLHFGVKNEMIDSVKIKWPDDKEQMIKNIPPKQLFIADYNNASLPSVGDEYFEARPASSLFSTVDAPKINFLHMEDEFVDFKIQALLPHTHSAEGPGLSVGDVNGDGLEDFYVGNGAGFKASIFLQQKNGSFAEKQMADSNMSDNMGAIFFDADNDGDLDLYVASGGSSAQTKDNPIYRHHLYLNDGKGNFTVSNAAIPSIITPASSVVACDFDKDGDLDLFICGRVSPGEYPYSPKSFLLRNDSQNKEGRFTDITKSAGADLSNIGMVTSALFTDFDNDSWIDLIVTGEFMPIRFFKNEHGKFREVTSETGLEHINGWWNSIVAGDFDKDGDIDYIVGNLGLNGPYKASAKDPVCIYANDYDKNGRLDPVMCHYIDGKEYTVHSRNDMNKQINAMRARFTTYEQYASLPFDKTFTKAEIAAAYVVKCERFESSYIENKGGGKFVVHALPLEAQFSPIFGMLANDFNGDGNPDVLCVGNSFSTEVQTGRYDAQGSLLLIGNGKGDFTVDRKTLNVSGDNKSVVQLSAAKGNDILIIGANSDSLKTFRVTKTGRTILLSPSDVYAIITEKNGNKYKQEFYYGNSYLSQSSRRFYVPPGTKSLNIYEYNGVIRTIDF
ncbi:MAG: VCBS repeat-containing protein [Bacteroidetes bacterium]|nr:VCBS repeat-containing protein [Bacteroidota bacterium]